MTRRRRTRPLSRRPPSSPSPLPPLHTALAPHFTPGRHLRGQLRRRHPRLGRARRARAGKRPHRVVGGRGGAQGVLSRQRRRPGGGAGGGDDERLQGGPRRHRSGASRQVRPREQRGRRLPPRGRRRAHRRRHHRHRGGARPGARSRRRKRRRLGRVPRRPPARWRDRLRAAEHRPHADQPRGGGSARRGDGRRPMRLRHGLRRGGADRSLPARRGRGVAARP
mmetsp:Transcript_16319/g.52101  ORF Transcript_16319/g.52101 Transcript_16319/m.52101 type:complete len:223 (+) Transcript_16319:105-773(+)